MYISKQVRFFATTESNGGVRGSANTLIGHSSLCILFFLLVGNYEKHSSSSLARVRITVWDADEISTAKAQRRVAIFTLIVLE